ncbi:MAG: multifunctional addition/repair protein [Betaproteobacteria bacterium]|nr:multifunctional addition/repair protein [Betaproteobacteria bacterium]
MKIYAVGGAVRDELLGLPVKDRDYVVVGATPDEMIELGYRAVGKDFPVFLHPETHEEYALARTERKSGRGYHGFQFHATPDVTLEQDLARRDLTINAMARDEEGRLIDPFNGADDLSEGVLRHVSSAFAEDPVRILRLARFASRFGFAIAPETADLMREMVTSGEADFLVAERVWQELARGLMEERPSRLFQVLQDSGALARIAPEIAAIFQDTDAAQNVMDALDDAAGAGEPLEGRFAVLARSMDPYAVEAMANRLKVPFAVRDLGVLAARHANSIVDADALTPEAILELLNATDAWRRPERFSELLRAALAGEPDRARAIRRLQRAREAGASVDGAAIAKESSKTDDIRSRVNAARLDAIRAALA